MTMQGGLQGRGEHRQTSGERIPRADGRRDDTLAEVSDTRQVGAATSYYNRPMLKKPTWKWFIPFYIFIGGLGGGVALIGGLADLFGGRRHRATVRRARYIALAAALISPLLLILDLGRPQRFHHMLRVFKVSSPLSVGTWILLAFGVTSGAQAARQAAEDNFIVKRESRLGRLARLLPGKPLSLAQALLGLGLGGYTGILLAATAIPLWATAGLLLGPLFLATAVASGAAALALLAGLRLGRSSHADVSDEDDEDEEEARADVETLATLSTATQLGLEIAREAVTPRTIGRPLRHGPWATVYRVGAVGGGMLMPLALRLPAQLRGRPVGRALSITAATLTLAGAVAERFAIVEAGKQSADDPHAYQEFTAGKVGSARPTPEQQALMAPKTKGAKPHIAAKDTR
ncbi:MAG TPA: NrfD/PsrC family molybdoenzyme membrane anchor subunit [Ktedonobacterales bacterium]|nr:NrfD/PsrC family molybdoenzyme membrane anchor subunit [Ktedonobacterales bacterium]